MSKTPSPQGVRAKSKTPPEGNERSESGRSRRAQRIGTAGDPEAGSLCNTSPRRQCHFQTDRYPRRRGKTLPKQNEPCRTINRPARLKIRGELGLAAEVVVRAEEPRVAAVPPVETGMTLVVILSHRVGGPVRVVRS